MQADAARKVFADSEKARRLSAERTTERNLYERGSVMQKATPGIAVELDVQLSSKGAVPE